MIFCFCFYLILCEVNRLEDILDLTDLEENEVKLLKYGIDSSAC